MKLPYALARRFVAGESLETALPAVNDLLDDGLFVTLDLLGEHVHDAARATSLTGSYIGLLHRIAEARADREAGISIKLSMIGQVIDEALCEDNLRRLLDVARETDTFVRLDMESTQLTQSTLDLFERVYPDYRDHVGTVLQAYLKRTDADVARMNKLNARVRLCKGAYAEPPSLAYQDMPTIREAYLRHMRALLTAGRYPAVATHDDRLIAATKEFARREGIGPDRFEFQMLYGLRPETQRELVREGYRMRVYVPYGTEWLPYFSRRLRERKENVFFVAKALLKG